MAKRYYIAIFIVFASINCFSFNFDLQKSERDSILKQINSDKIIINKRKLFEDVPWGSKIEAVKQSENRTLLNETLNELDYELTIDSLTGVLAYSFNNNGLDSVIIIFRQEDNYDVYGVEYSDILYNIVDEMELYLGKPVYTDTLREKDVQRHPIKNHDLINSIHYIWNFPNTKVTATKTNIPGLPIIIKYISKNSFNSGIAKKDFTVEKKKGWLFENKNIVVIFIVIVLALRVFSRLIRTLRNKRR